MDLGLELLAHFCPLVGVLVHVHDIEPPLLGMNPYQMNCGMLGGWG